MSAFRPLRRIAVVGVLAAFGACSNPPADPRVAAFAKLPDWHGVWVAEGMEPAIDGFSPADPATAAWSDPGFFIDERIPFNEAGQKKVQALMAASGGNPDINPSGVGGWGYPLMMRTGAPIEFFVTPEVTLVVNYARDLRQIYTDGRGHRPAEEGWPPTTWGDSVGRWEGDTLIIDTIQVRDPQLYFGLAAPFSEQARYTERLRKTAPDRIEGEMTIEDPATLAKPYVVKLAYVRSTEVDRLFYDSFSNNRSGFDGQFNTIEPPRE
jgi:hypothetical protein